jgi:hypothetical protein
MRSILTAVFVAALVAVPAQSKAAQRSIDDCEKILAADAYNQCLALFGPLARGHGTAGDGVDTARQAAAATTRNANSGAATAGDSRRGRHYASKHGWTRHSWARHGHRHRTRAARHRHGRTTSVAFNVVSGHARLR